MCLPDLVRSKPDPCPRFCRLVVALVQDLQMEVYPLVRAALLPPLMGILSGCRDVERLEWFFSALAHLYKALWR
jgi:hypothetical protein